MVAPAPWGWQLRSWGDSFASSQHPEIARSKRCRRGMAGPTCEWLVDDENTMWMVGKTESNWWWKFKILRIQSCLRGIWCMVWRVICPLPGSIRIHKEMLMEAGCKNSRTISPTRTFQDDFIWIIFGAGPLWGCSREDVGNNFYIDPILPELEDGKNMEKYCQSTITVVWGPRILLLTYPQAGTSVRDHSKN